jgi:AcrR family transcriptional regulator
MADSTTTRPMRADARRNRERLLEVAVELFAERGDDVSLNAVAQRAGVGIGTLYRHFPDRDALIEEAYRAEVAHLSHAAGELLAEHPPDVALAEWMRRFVGYSATKRGMHGALQRIAARTGLFSESRAQMLRAIGELLDAGVAAGVLRSDVTPDDVRRAMGSLWMLTGEEEGAAQAEALIRIIVDGLRHGAGAQ